jgi:hypothetical protein
VKVATLAVLPLPSLSFSSSSFLSASSSSTSSWLVDGVSQNGPGLAFVGSRVMHRREYTTVCVCVVSLWPWTVHLASYGGEWDVSERKASSGRLAACPTWAVIWGGGWTCS